jgi:hypothetical protein
MKEHHEFTVTWPSGQAAIDFGFVPGAYVARDAFGVRVLYLGDLTIRHGEALTVDKAQQFQDLAARFGHSFTKETL